ncbi:MAG: hypothetical protein AAGI63_19710 [Planctomycetota bacterium]
MTRRFMVMALALMVSSSAYAHPGHGDSDSSHYWTEPQHIVPLLILAVLFAAVAALVWRQSPSRSRSA